MLKLEKVSCGYGGAPVVQDISFQLERGERLCIVGPNGCGKSTLLKAMVGLLPHEGCITLDGVALQKLTRREMAGQLALMSQISSVYFSYTVAEAVMMGRYARMNATPFAEPSRTDWEAVEQCLDTVNLTQLKDRPITDLSGGELQRVFLAKAFAQEPRVLLLDEPTNHLDLKHQIELVSHLKRWAAQEERMVVAVLHDLNLALSFADRLLVMSHGGSVACGSREQILHSGCLNEVYGLDVQAYMLHACGQWQL